MAGKDTTAWIQSKCSRLSAAISLARGPALSQAASGAGRLVTHPLEEAFTLAAARRCLRAPDAPPLNPIRALHYFASVIEEVSEKHLPDGYLEYLKYKLKKSRLLTTRCLPKIGAIPAKRAEVAVFSPRTPCTPSAWMTLIPFLHFFSKTLFLGGVNK